MEDEVYDGIDYEELELEEILQEQKVKKVDGHLRFKTWNNFRRAERNKRVSDSKSKGTNLAKWLNVALEYFDNRCALSGEDFVEFEEKASNHYTNNLSAEHVVALTNGGQDILPNLVPSVLQYNIRKNGYYLLDWWEKQDNVDGASIYSPCRLLQLVNYMTKSLDAREYFKSGKFSKYRDAILTPNDIDLFLAEIKKIDEAISDDRNAERNLISSVQTATTEIEDGKKILTSIPDLEEGIPEQVNQPLMEKQNEREMIDIFLYDAILKLKEDLTLGEIERIKNQARENGVDISNDLSIDKVIQSLEDTQKNLEGAISYELEIRASLMSVLKDLGIETNEYSIANILMFSNEVLAKMNEKCSAQEFESYISLYLTEKMNELSKEFGITVEETKSILIYNTEALYKDEAKENVRLVLNFCNQTGFSVGEVLNSNSYTQIVNLLKIEKWCRETFEGKPEYKRRMPRATIRGVMVTKGGEVESEEQREIKLGRALSAIKLKYKERSKEELTTAEQGLLEKLEKIEKEYRLSDDEKNILEIEEWCQETFKGEPKYKRRMPRAAIKGVKVPQKDEVESEEQREIRLGTALSGIKQKYQGKSKEELTLVEQGLLERLEKIEREYRLSADEKNILEIEEWCRETFKSEPEYKRRMPRKGIIGVKVAKKDEVESEEQREIRLGTALSAIKLKYQGKSKEELTSVEQGLLERLNQIEREYRLNDDEKNILEIEEWCRETFEGEPEYKRRIPRTGIRGVKSAKEGEVESEAQREIRLGTALYSIKQKYKEKSKEELTTIEQDLLVRLEKIEREYRLNDDEKNILEIEEWCRETFEGEPEYKRRMPRVAIRGVKVAKEGEEEGKDQRELRLGQALNRIKQKYKGKSKEKLTSVEQGLLERLSKIEREYNIDLKALSENILEIEEWCRETFENEPKYKRRIPRACIRGVKAVKEDEVESEEQRERRLGLALSGIKQKYQGKSKEELTLVEQGLLERLEKIEGEYRLSDDEKNILEIEEWCRETFEGELEYKRRMPRATIRGVKAAKEGEIESEAQRESRLGKALSKIKHKYKEKSREELTQVEQGLLERLDKIASEYDIQGTTKSFLQSILKSRATLSGALQAAQEIASFENARNVDIEI